MKIFKRIIIFLIAALAAAGVLFTTACSEDEVDALVSVASEVISEAAEENNRQDEQQTPETTAREDETGITIQETTGKTEETTEPETESEQETTTADNVFETEEQTDEPETFDAVDEQIPEDGEYLSMEQVSVYLHIYGHLPDNFLTKKEAKKLGWKPGKKNLWEVAPGCAIGGDKFGNREKLLPSKKGRQYYECDVNYDGGERGAERIVYSNDGLIYYTDNHYEDFMLLFDGDE